MVNPNAENIEGICTGDHMISKGEEKPIDWFIIILTGSIY